MRTKCVGSVLLSILLATSLIALTSFAITITSAQTASANTTQENFTIVALPDVQNESQYYPSIFENQTKWIVQNENVLNIVFVIQLGDLVNTYNDNTQWQNADSAMSILDGKVPYSVLPGNHDLDGGPSPVYNAGATHYENYFPASRYEGQPYWGGSYDSSSVISSSPNMNNYQLFTWDGMNFITLNIQYYPAPDVLAWADSVLSKYSDRRAIISTHSYLNPDGSWAPSGASIYKNVVVPNKNVFLVLCGHEFGANGYGVGERIDNLDNNRTVYQLLSDYQEVGQGGNGWLRIMKFVPSESTIYVKTYSPYLDNYWEDSANQFEMAYPMSATPATGGGGIPLTVYVGAIVVIVVIIAAVLIYLGRHS